MPRARRSRRSAPRWTSRSRSNFERALFEASGRDAGWTAQAMDEFAREQQLVLPPHGAGRRCARAMPRFACDDAETLATISAVCQRRTGRLIDPHTAVGIAAACKLGGLRQDRWLCSRPPIRPSSPTP